MEISREDTQVGLADKIGNLLILCPFREVPLSHPRVNPTTGEFFFFFYLFCSKVVWLIGPGIFRGNCPFGGFKGRYAGRIGRQN